ncbi:hypothetical protein PHYBOEH_008773 [Phytophthora boehmeriae]|uniref:PH domain-containing protein n=1 Tax=Phytophthora boehmeriae TaxID=109152 RepID=A0A8T1W238_9STRA|nr:hypothetical protein PHYBOEH_008773 [Phytophthora boehmeriae]
MHNSLQSPKPLSLRRTSIATDDTDSVATQQLKGWMYWQRDPLRQPQCWTKVFAVLDAAFLWLFQREESAPRSLLVQVAVASVERVDTPDGGRLLSVCDTNGQELCVCLCSDDSYDHWRSRLADAAELTTAFFRNSGLDVQDLPRTSSYRGTLEEYRRVSKRTKCRNVVAQFMRSLKAE